MASIDTSSPTWDQFAATFAKTIEQGPGVLPAETLLAELDAIRPLSSATTILDVGCGAGQVTNMLVNKFGNALSENAKILATDNSPGMLEQIEKRKTYVLAKDASSLWQKVQSQLCDVQDMSSISDSSISHVTAGFVLFIISNAQGAMKEIGRVLVPGGGLALSSWKGSDWIDMVDLLKVIRPDFIAPKISLEWGTVEGIRDTLERCEYQNINVHYCETLWEYDAPEEVVRTVLEFPFVVYTMQSWAKHEVDEFKAQAVAFLTEKYGSGHGAMKGTAIVGSGSKGT